MYFFRRMSPLRAYRDLRDFLSRRKKHELWFLLASAVVTSYLITAIGLDSRAEAPYKPNIIYVQQWPLNRSEADVLADLKVDAAKKAKDNAVRDKAEAARRADFKKLSDKVSPWL